MGTTRARTAAAVQLVQPHLHGGRRGHAAALLARFVDERHATVREGLHLAHHLVDRQRRLAPRQRAPRHGGCAGLHHLAQRQHGLERVGPPGEQHVQVLQCGANLLAQRGRDVRPAVRHRGGEGLLAGQQAHGVVGEALQALLAVARHVSAAQRRRVKRLQRSARRRQRRCKAVGPRARPRRSGGQRRSARRSLAGSRCDGAATQVCQRAVCGAAARAPPPPLRAAVAPGARQRDEVNFAKRRHCVGAAKARRQPRELWPPCQRLGQRQAGAVLRPLRAARQQRAQLLRGERSSQRMKTRALGRRNRQLAHTGGARAAAARGSRRSGAAGAARVGDGGLCRVGVAVALTWGRGGSGRCAAGAPGARGGSGALSRRSSCPGRPPAQKALHGAASRAASEAVAPKTRLRRRAPSSPSRGAAVHSAHARPCAGSRQRRPSGAAPAGAGGAGSGGAGAAAGAAAGGPGAAAGAPLKGTPHSVSTDDISSPNGTSSKPARPTSDAGAAAIPRPNTWCVPMKASCANAPAANACMARDGAPAVQLPRQQLARHRRRARPQRRGGRRGPPANSSRSRCAAGGRPARRCDALSMQ